MVAWQVESGGGGGLSGYVAGMRTFELHRAALRVFCLVAVAGPAAAHPVAYKGASQFMFTWDERMPMAEFYHSYTARTAFGLHWTRFDEGDDEHDAFILQHNWLVKRWNLPDAQANFWGALGAGASRAEGGGAAALGLGYLRLDYETRRIYAAADATLYAGGDLTHLVSRAGLGWAPYKAEFDQINTWILLIGEHATGMEDEFSLVPGFRFFWKNIFVELGASTKGDLRTQFMIHF
jgi:hypothetical protein